MVASIDKLIPKQACWLVSEQQQQRPPEIMALLPRIPKRKGASGRVEGVSSPRKQAGSPDGGQTYNPETIPPRGSCGEGSGSEDPKIGKLKPRRGQETPSLFSLACCAAQCATTIDF